MLKLRNIGQNDYNVFEDAQHIGRIRYAGERNPGVWIWNVQVHVTGGLPMGTAKTLDDAKAAFKASWEAFKARVGPDRLAAAYRSANIRG